MEKLNFSAFEGFNDRDKKILNSFYKILSRKFDFKNSAGVYTVDLVDYIISRIGLPMPYIDLRNYVKFLRIYNHGLLDDYKFNNPLYKKDHIFTIDENDEKNTFIYFLRKYLKEEDTLNLIKKCFKNKVIYKNQRDVEFLFDTTELELGYAIPLNVRVVKKRQNDTLEYVRMLFVNHIDYENMDSLKVKISIANIEKTFNLPSFWRDIRNPKKEDFIKFLCEDLVPYYGEIIKKYLD